METKVGNRIFSEIKRPSQKLLEQFKGIPSSNIGDMMNRLFNMHSEIKAYGEVTSLVGPAFTIKAPEGDNLFFHIALEMAEPGDIIVVDSSGCMSRALCGEMMYNYAKNKGIAGFVIDGCIRDVDSLAGMDFPVYARGVTPQGPWKNGPGEINSPVVCGGQVVRPGDILVGDQDGVIVIRPEDADAVLAPSKDKFAQELKQLEAYHSKAPVSNKGKMKAIALDKGAVIL